MKSKLFKQNKNLILCIACGVLCALLVWAYAASLDAKAASAQSEALAKYGGDQIDVCVARTDLKAGDVISEGDIEVKTWIASMLPADAVTLKSDAVGKQLGSSILAGEVISTKRFGSAADSVDVPDGYVAISLPAKDVQALGGSIKVGQRIDIYATGSSSTAKICSSLQVLATSGDSSSSAWITVAVLPSKVEELVRAAENLELYFTLPGSNVDASAGSSSAATSSSSSGSSSGATDTSSSGVSSKAESS